MPKNDTARKPENDAAGKPENDAAGKPENDTAGSQRKLSQWLTLLEMEGEQQEIFICAHDELVA